MISKPKSRQAWDSDYKVSMPTTLHFTSPNTKAQPINKPYQVFPRPASNIPHIKIAITLQASSILHIKLHSMAQQQQQEMAKFLITRIDPNYTPEYNRATTSRLFDFQDLPLFVTDTAASSIQPSQKVMTTATHFSLNPKAIETIKIRQGTERIGQRPQKCIEVRYYPHFNVLYLIQYILGLPEGQEPQSAFASPERNVAKNSSSDFSKSDCCLTPEPQSAAALPERTVAENSSSDFSMSDSCSNSSSSNTPGGISTWMEDLPKSNAEDVPKDIDDYHASQDAQIEAGRRQREAFTN
ncbi:hypothetical protein EJ08DRAFT_133117 [Tothia fuscella]|uniref:Uncharacterized protein n=1 Tax=Tothia fuscella TaxID=1048955 RepID=A0A9P4NVF6_9PEZI|nr:hypothetical protein EJ08DRAFT_133117 [Tothia fuscella]